MQLIAMIICAFSGVKSSFEASVIGACFAIGFYFGREVAQSERKQGGKPWWIGFDMRLWSKDAIFDFVTPTVYCIAVCTLIYFFC